MTWKKIGVRGKPVWVAEWPTFEIEIHTSGGYHTPYVRMKDGTHGYGLGLYLTHDLAKREGEKAGERLALQEAGRVVVSGNPPLVLGRREKRKEDRGAF